MLIESTQSTQSSEPPPSPKLALLNSGGITPVPPSLDTRGDRSQVMRELQCFCAGLSALIYRYNLQGLRRLLKLEGADTFQGFTTEFGKGLPSATALFSKVGMGFVYQQRAWLVFRGSDDAYDWDTNFRFFKTDEQLHSGFHDAWSGMQNRVIEWYREVSATTSSIVITGHSLGGAMGVIAAKTLAEQQLNNVEAVLTFGAPRVGSSGFVKQYNQTPAGIQQQDHVRLTLGEVTYQSRIADDIVPKVPPRFLNFEHCGKPGDVLWNNPYDATSHFESVAEEPTTDTTIEYNFFHKSTDSGILETLSGVTKLFSSLFPLHQMFFSTADRLKQGGMSHRMVGYQNRFGPYLSFRSAIGRDQSIIEQIQDETEKNQTATSKPVPLSIHSPSASHPSLATNQFHVEKVTGWTPVLTGVSLLVIVVLAASVFAMIRFVNPEYQLMAILLLLAGTLSLGLNAIKEIKGG
ncbi:MAG: lipase family protein [Candidatus Thiodiazotropha weberae]|nr:lipase family protein [Candidatus Thiodiazotropha weberae]